MPTHSLKVIVSATGFLIGLLIMSKISEILSDCVVQGKWEVEINLKKSRWGVSYVKGVEVRCRKIIIRLNIYI